MSTQRTAVWIAIIVVLAVGVLAGLFWLNLRIQPLLPQDTEFITYWAGARALTYDRQSPYNDSVTARLQTLVYQRPARQADPVIYASYPLYAILIFLPFSIPADYALARAIWMTFQEGLLFLLVIFGIRLVRWRPAGWLLGLLLFFSLFWFHGGLALIDGTSVILVAVLVILALIAIRAERDELAGLALALTTIHPQAVPLLLVFLILWAINQHRWLMIAWFFGTIAFLSIVGLFFISDWPLQYLRVLIRFGEPQPSSLGAVLAKEWPGLGPQFGWGVMIVLAGVLLVEWRLALGQDFRWFLWTAGLTLTISQWIGVPTRPVNFILLFIPLLLVFAVWEERAGPKGSLFTLASLLLLGLGLWALYVRAHPLSNWLIQPAIFFFPLPLFLLVCLYWVRWWATRPPQLFVAKLRQTGL